MPDMGIANSSPPRAVAHAEMSATQGTAKPSRCAPGWSSGARGQTLDRHPAAASSAGRSYFAQCRRREGKPSFQTTNNQPTAGSPDALLIALA